MTTDRFEARVERAHQLLAEAAALLLRHAEPPTSQQSGGSSSGSSAPLLAAVQAFETAITLAPHLRPVAVSQVARGAPRGGLLAFGRLAGWL